MNAIDPYLLIRAAALYLPIVIGAVVFVIRRPNRRELIGAFLAFVWNVPAVLALHVLAIGAGWWRFDADGGMMLGMPIDLWLSWAWLWGPVAAIAFPSMPLLIVTLIAVALDLVLMPAAFPVVRLGDQWLIGEGVAVALCLVPAQLVARWTRDDRRLVGRAVLQVIAFTALVVWLLPAIAIEASGTTWRNPFAWPPSIVSLVIQLIAVPAIVGLSAVQEFVARGAGTPIPYDPPRRIVTTGVYAYVANPMQLSATIVLLLIGAVIGNAWVASAAVIALAYSAGLAHWDEDADLRERFGDAWPQYRRDVRQWLPRLRPWYRDDSPIASLYVSEHCHMCREVAHWYRSRGARGLTIVSAEDHPRDALKRITYESVDGTYRAAGTDAIARALEHLHLGWAFVGFAIRLPVISNIVRIIVDASGGHPRIVRRRSPKLT